MATKTTPKQVTENELAIAAVKRKAELEKLRDQVKELQEKHARDMEWLMKRMFAISSLGCPGK